MPRLEITLLGSPQIKVDGKPIEGLPAKAQALLIYLVMTKQQHGREHLAELLFSDETMPADKKLSNLRGAGALLALNRVLGEFLVTQYRLTLAFRVESDYQLDVDEFERCLRQPQPTAAQLETAVQLYRGDFLTGLSLRHDAAGFEDWAQLNRQRLRRLAMNALYLLAVHYKQEGQPIPGIACVTRLLEFEPLLDEANRELMLLYANTEQVSKAIEQYEKYQELLETELGLEPEKATRDLYKQLIRGEYRPPTPTPIISSPPKSWLPPFQTPPKIAHFVGRREVLARLVAELRQDGPATMHALVGMGGVGKSTLAVEAAHTTQEHFEDGVLWASAASEPTAVLESWAQAYGHDFSQIGDLESRANAFRGLLAQRRVLLVLDDVTSAARVRPLLPNGPGCRVLLTTRNQELAIRLNAQVWPLEELSRAEGRLLLGRILGEERVNAEPEAAAAVCALLQNLPLAVEIIGQRLKSRPERRLTDVVQRLQDEKQRLSELKISDDPEVRASFGLSYTTLGNVEQQAFALMGVFHGRSFPVEAFAALIPPPMPDRYETEDRVFGLAALSLVRQVGKNGQRRYKQHALLADFAREKLAEGKQEQEVYGRLAHYYLAFAQQHQHAYDILRPEWDNLMAAMQAAHNYALWQTVTDFADTLHPAWFARGRYTQARQGFEWAQQAAQERGDRVALAACLLHWGEVCVEQNDYEAARQHVGQSLQIYREVDDRPGTADACYHLARIALEQNHYSDAEKLLAECLQLYEQAGNELGKAGVYFRQARIFYEAGNYQKARERAKQAYDIRLGHDDKQGLIPVLRYLAQIALLEKQFDQAQNDGMFARQLSEQLEDRGELAATLYVLVSMYRVMAKYEEALQYAEEAQTICDVLGLLRFQALLLYEKSLIFRQLHRFAQALECSKQSIQMFQDLQDDLHLAYALTSQGDIYKAMGQKDKSRDSWRKVKIIAEARQHAYLLALLAERESEPVVTRDP